MGVALSDTATLTREEFRRWYDDQPTGRYERIDDQIVAMAPGRAAQARVKAAVWLALRRAISEAGTPCEAMPDGMAVETADSDYEPAALVNCCPWLPAAAFAASNPVVVVEVLSPGTASSDTGAKLAGYFQVPSIAHYLIVHPAKRVVIHHRRAGSTIGTRSSWAAGSSLIRRASGSPSRTSTRRTEPLARLRRPLGAELHAPSVNATPVRAVNSG